MSGTVEIGEYSKDHFVSEEEIGGRGGRNWKGRRKRRGEKKLSMAKLLCLLSDK